MVAPREHRLPRRRAESRSVEAVVLQTIGSKLLKVRRPTRSTEGAGCREAHVVEQDDQYVGCAFGWAQRLDRGKLRIWIFGVIRCKTGVRLGRNGKNASGKVSAIF